MAYPLDPEWRMNITTEDIVYPFVDSTKTVYRKKTIELKTENGINTTVTVISEIKYQSNGTKAERILSEAEFSVEQFEAMKEWSDGEYQKQVRSYVKDNRKSVARVDDMEDCPAIAFYEKFAGDEVEEDDESYRTVENALRILDELHLTETQRRRYLANHFENLSTEAIARRENVNQNAIWKSIDQVEAKKEKYFKKFSPTPQKKGG